MADYDAFISYSHAKDKPVAAALQSAVQRLGKPWYRRRALRVFRDDTSLSATPHLWPSIKDALGRSRYLILLVSPQSAASPWVGKEIAYWLSHKSIDTLLMAVTEGEVGWDNAAGDFIWAEATPLPLALKGKFSAEPKWIDLRDYRDPLPSLPPTRGRVWRGRDAKFLDLAADLAAAVHGMPKEDLLSQEVRQQRRALTLAWSAAATLLVLTAAAVWQWQVANIQRAKAENALTAATGTADRLVFDMAVNLRNQPGMPVQTVMKILGGMQTMQDELSKAGNLTPELRREQAVALGALAATLNDQRQLDAARNDAERAVAIMNDLVKLDPDNAQYQRGLAIALNQLGDVRFHLDDRAGALALYNQSLGIIQKLAAAAPDNAGLQRDAVASITRIGGLQFVTGQRQDALATARRSVAMLTDLTGKQPDQAEWQYNLSSADTQLGMNLQGLGQSAAALRAYKDALAIRQKIAAANPNNTDYQRGLFDSYLRVGGLAAGSSDALAAYQSGLAVIEKLAAGDPGNGDWQNQLSIAYGKVGDALAMAGSNDQALANFRNSIAIQTRLAIANPGSTDWQYELSVSLNKIGDALAATGKPDDALTEYQQALDISQKLAAAAPDNSEWQGALAFCYGRIGDAVRFSDRPRARDAYQKSLAIRAKLADADTGDLTLQRQVALIHERLAALSAADGSTDDAKASLQQAVAMREHIARTDPDNTLWQAELASSLMQLAAAGDDPQPHLQRALALLQKLDSAGKLAAAQKHWIGAIEQALAALPQPQ
jgi:tetratricopeptide (TPR) repeat protein